MSQEGKGWDSQEWQRNAKLGRNGKEIKRRCGPGKSTPRRKAVGRPRVGDGHAR